MRSPAAPCAAFCQQPCTMRNSTPIFPDVYAMRSSQQTGKSTVDLRVDFLTAFAPGTYFTQFFA
ncbi:hypothetical protein A2U01_0035560 [Trifolium medium]|uniref:Uncharacterized protein n=1 Tax=Trifolium medium TaxID=97028 RepID=A0A392PSF3_9FABA|nr:hypothetical protein [Trifolium medium]